MWYSNSPLCGPCEASNPDHLNIARLWKDGQNDLGSATLSSVSCLFRELPKYTVSEFCSDVRIKALIVCGN